MGSSLVRFEFASPWLLLLVPVALLLLLAARRRGRRLVGWSSDSLVQGLPTGWRARLAWLPAALLGVGVVLATVALARPRVGDESTIVKTEGIAITMVVDTSSSMLAHDFTDADGQPTDRLSAVKSVVREFVAGGDELPGRAADAVSLVVFAGYADSTCPLTFDHRMLLETLDAAEIAQTRFEDGTSIGQGLAVALGRLREAEVTSRVVILLTDGENNDQENDPMEAARVAAELGVRVYTIGMGSRGLAPYPTQDPRTGKRIFRSVPVQIDEVLLQRIAETTGGIYQRAGSTDSLRAIYAAIDRLERTELEGVTYRRWRELFPYPLCAGALLWVLSLLLEGTLLRRLG